MGLSMEVLRGCLKGHEIQVVVVVVVVGKMTAQMPVFCANSVDHDHDYDHDYV